MSSIDNQEVNGTQQVIKAQKLPHKYIQTRMTIEVKWNPWIHPWFLCIYLAKSLPTKKKKFKALKQHPLFRRRVLASVSTGWLLIGATPLCAATNRSLDYHTQFKPTTWTKSNAELRSVLAYAALTAICHHPIHSSWPPDRWLILTVPQPLTFLHMRRTKWVSGVRWEAIASTVWGNSMMAPLKCWLLSSDRRIKSLTVHYGGLLRVVGGRGSYQC